MLDNNIFQAYAYQRGPFSSGPVTTSKKESLVELDDLDIPEPDYVNKYQDSRYKPVSTEAPKSYMVSDFKVSDKALREDEVERMLKDKKN